jgi:hypothetical protein
LPGFFLHFSLQLVQHSFDFILCSWLHWVSPLLVSLVSARRAVESAPLLRF